MASELRSLADSVEEGTTQLEDLEVGVDVETAKFLLHVKVDTGMCVRCDINPAVWSEDLCADCICDRGYF